MNLPHIERLPFARLLSVFILFAATQAGAATATAVAYPVKPIRFIVPFAAGGGTDVMARAVAIKYTETWGQPVVVDNRAGGNGNTGTEMVAKAPANGYTLSVNTNATIVDKLYRETRRILMLPETRSRFEPTGTVMTGNTPAEFVKLIKGDLAKWAAVIKASGAKME